MGKKINSIEIEEVLSSREKPGQGSRSGHVHHVRRDSQVSYQTDGIQEGLLDSGAQRACISLENKRQVAKI